MDTKSNVGFPYSPSIEKNMKMFYDSLSEKDKRHYAALEATKLGHGGVTYLSHLLGCARSTIQAGMDEFKKK